MGTYDIIIEKGTLTNSSIITVNGKLTITKAPLTISTGDYTKEVGDANPTFALSFEGFKNDETNEVLIKQPVISCSATESSPVGTYPVIISDAEAQNYDITYKNGTLTVKERTENIISFIDANVETICINNWDNNGDGVLSKQEAAAVKDIGLVFQNIINITSFNELLYFTGLTAIGNGAFSNCSNLTSIAIPSSVSSIGSGAFSNCKGLTSISIPDAVKSIEANTFSGCSGLTSFSIPSSVTSIGEKALEGCTGLSSITIPNSVASIGDNAFNGCNNLTSVVMGSGVTSIGANAFKNTNLKKTVWLSNTPPTGYKNAEGAVNYVSNDLYSSIGNMIVYPYLSSMFLVDGIRYVPVSPSEKTCDAIDCVYDSTSINTTIGTQVTYRGISMTVKKAMPYLCYNNKYIKDLAWNYGGNIPNYAFAECSNIEQFYSNESKGPGCLVIDSKVNNIGNYAFSGCKEIKTVIISDRDSLLTLGSNGNSPLFASLALDSVYIGGNISYPTGSGNGYSPFYRNETLRSVVITDKETEISPNEFYGCTNLQSFTVGDGVTTFGDWAFSGCSSLKSLSFGTQLQTIGKEAFSDCTAVTKIISKAATPPICSSQALDDISKWTCTLFVPTGSLSAYQTADQWKDFFFVEEGEGGNSEEPSTTKCAMPTIDFVDGELTFSCETEGVEYVYEITSTDVKKGNASKVKIDGKLKVSVYATKEGYENSDVATKDIELSAGDVGDVNGDGVIDVSDYIGVANIILTGNIHGK